MITRDDIERIAEKIMANPQDMSMDEDLTMMGIEPDAFRDVIERWFRITIVDLVQGEGNVAEAILDSFSGGFIMGYQIRLEIEMREMKTDA